MPIRPELAWASEQHLVRASTAVLTNTRPDHFGDLGTSPDATSEALRWVMPTSGRLIAADEAIAPPLLAWAAARRSGVRVVATLGLAPLEANRALALAVCAAHGVGPEVAHKGHGGGRHRSGRFLPARDHARRVLRQCLRVQ